MRHTGARQTPRVEYPAEVELFRAEDQRDSGPILCAGRDLSEGGIGVHSPQPLVVGTAVTCRVEVEGRRHELPGTVAWSAALDPDLEPRRLGVGIRFRDLAPRECSVVADLVRRHDAQQMEAGSVEPVQLHFEGLQGPVSAHASRSTTGITLRARLPFLARGNPVDFAFIGRPPEIGRITDAQLVAGKNGEPEIAIRIAAEPQGARSHTDRQAEGPPGGMPRRIRRKTFYGDQTELARSEGQGPEDARNARDGSDDHNGASGDNGASGERAKPERPRAATLAVWRHDPDALERQAGAKPPEAGPANGHTGAEASRKHADAPPGAAASGDAGARPRAEATQDAGASPGRVPPLLKIAGLAGTMAAMAWAFSTPRLEPPPSEGELAEREPTMGGSQQTGDPAGRARAAAPRSSPDAPGSRSPSRAPMDREQRVEETSSGVPWTSYPIVPGHPGPAGGASYREEVVAAVSAIDSPQLPRTPGIDGNGHDGALALPHSAPGSATGSSDRGPGIPAKTPKGLARTPEGARTHDSSQTRERERKPATSRRHPHVTGDGRTTRVWIPTTEHPGSVSTYSWKRPAAVTVKLARGRFALAYGVHRMRQHGVDRVVVRRRLAPARLRVMLSHPIRDYRVETLDSGVQIELELK